MEGTASQKAQEFERLAGQISSHSGGTWSMQPRMAGSDGSIIYVGEGAPYVMVISPEGRVFSGNFTTDTTRAAGSLLPKYDQLKEIK